jgi:hypothetical protein
MKNNYKPVISSVADADRALVSLAFRIGTGSGGKHQVLGAFAYFSLGLSAVDAPLCCANSF